MRLVIYLIIPTILTSVDCKKILGIYGHPGRSHQILGEIILKKLAERGHQVTMVSAFPLKKPLPNYKDVFLDGFIEELSEDDALFLEMEKDPLLNYLGGFKLIHDFTNKTFAHPAMQKLIKSGEKFDLVIIDWFCKDSELFYGNIFEAPVIATSSFGAQIDGNYVVNNPEPYSYVPVSGFSYTDDMTFFDRMGNTFAAICVEAILLYNKMQHQTILDSYFKGAPRIDELYGNLDLLFINSHPVFETPRPYLPNVIPIGGLHVQEPASLPQDLQEFLDKSPQGVVFFSMGSHMKTSGLPQDILESILRAFDRIPQNVLLKWEKDEVPKLPKNVKTGKWFPQNSILAHPNLKVFITHGGLMGKIEAIYHATPMIGIPLFGDQPSNVMHSVNEGIGLKLGLGEISEDNLVDAINRIINDSSFSEKIKKKSMFLKDQPMKPLDAAVYWAEFVMKHNGTKHLQNKSMRLYKFQYLLLDVAAFVIGVGILILKLLKHFGIPLRYVFICVFIYLAYVIKQLDV